MDKQNKADKSAPTGATADATAAGKPSWDHINSDLKTALDTWTELTDTMANKLSPEEEQLREIKSILGSLKDKLKAFENDEPATTAAQESASAPAAPSEKPTEENP